MHILIQPSLQEALDYSKAAHESIGQKRRDNITPYYVHPWEVAERVWGATHNYEITKAALFHDILEDVTPKNPEYNLAAISEKFGKAVAFRVQEVTNVFTEEKYPSFTYDERKLAEKKRISEISYPAKIIKLADIAANATDLAKLPRTFSEKYVKKQIELMSVLVDGHTGLWEDAMRELTKQVIMLGRA